MQHTTPVNHFPAKIAGTVTATLVLVVLAVFLSASSVGHQAFAVTSAEKQAEAQEALAALNSMQETLDRLSAEYGEALMAQEEAEANCAAAEQRIGELNEEIADTQKQLGDHARDMYRTGGITFLDMLLGANSFEEFATSLDMANRVNQGGADLVDKERALREEAESQKAEYAEQAAIASAKAAEAEEAAAQAEATVAEMQATYDSLSAEAAQLLEEEREAERKAEEARAAAAVAEAAARAQAEAEAAAQAAAQGTTGGATDDGGDAATVPTYDPAADTEPVVTEGTAYEGGSDVVSRAYACLGAPYVWGGVGPYGYDCSGLVSYCLSGQHTRLGTTYTFMGWTQVTDPQPGDVCVSWTHTGIYIGGGQMIHAADYGTGVIIGPVQSGMIIVRY